MGHIRGYSVYQVIQHETQNRKVCEKAAKLLRCAAHVSEF